MQPHPVTVEPDTPAEAALSLMATQDVTCLPVLANNKLVGILTDHDCLKIVRSVLATN